jgi:hypothetical protein
MILFDHLEVHVKDSNNYAIFLKQLFKYGRFKKISDNNTYMFIGSSDLHIEIKENSNYIKTFNLEDGIGFCMPCLRMKGAEKHLNTIKKITIDYAIDNPDGKCFFFTDYEGIKWHFKDYDLHDIFVNI